MLILKVLLALLVSFAAALCTAACIGGMTACICDLYCMLRDQYKCSRKQFWITVGLVACVVALTTAWFSFIFPWILSQPV